jgi:hypothetical protein
MSKQVNNKLSYSSIRKEIQDKILNLCKKADKDFRDLDVELLNAQLQFDYGVGSLSINRIIDNLITLNLVKVQDGKIKRVIEMPSKQGREAEDIK